MPHLEIKYSADIKLDHKFLFDQIESMINQLDPTAGVCKSRAYPTDDFKNSHVMIDLWLLPKKHRDHAFSQTLLTNLKTFVNNLIGDHHFVSIQIHYRDDNYITAE